MKGWKRRKPGVYVRVIDGYRYEVMRYFLPGRVTYGRWLVYGSNLQGHIPAFHDLESAKRFAEETAAEARAGLVKFR